jgi:hypothetical protein
METTTSQTESTAVVPVETPNQVELVETLLSLFTEKTKAQVIAGNSAIMALLLAELLPRLNAEVSAEGNTFSAIEAAGLVVDLYSNGKDQNDLVNGKNTHPAVVQAIKDNNVDIHDGKDTKNGGCYIPLDRVETFYALDEFIGEQGLSRSRASRGIWGLSRVKQSDIDWLVANLQK